MKSKRYIKKYWLEFGEDYQQLKTFKTMQEAKDYISFRGLKEFTLTKEYSDFENVEYTRLLKA